MNQGKGRPARAALASALMLWLLAGPWAAPGRAEGELVRANQHRAEFLADSERIKSRSNWLALIKEYENAALAQTESRFAGQARAWGADLALTVGRKFKQAADFEKADQLARRAVRDCPRCSYSAESQFISGQALFELKQLDSAVKQLLKVELNYPDSPLVDKAGRLLAQIRGRPAPEAKAPEAKAPAPAAEANPSAPAPAAKAPEAKAPESKPSAPPPAAKASESKPSAPAPKAAEAKPSESKPSAPAPKAKVTESKPPAPVPKAAKAKPSESKPPAPAPKAPEAKAPESKPAAPAAKAAEAKPSESKPSAPAAKTAEVKPSESKPSEPKPAAPAPKAPEIPAPPKPRADGLAQVYFLHLKDQGHSTTVTAYLDKTTAYLYNLIPAAGGSFRAYADLKNTVIAPGTKLQLREKTPLVSLVKINQYQNDVTRLVLDLPQAYPYRPAFLDKPPRLVFQVARETNTLQEPQPEAAPEPPPRRPAGRAGGAKGPLDSLARQLGLKVKTVVIDPGHGGKDTGATSFGLREKDITLKLGLKLADRLTRRLGLTVFLTRSDDRFLTLSRRARIALEKKADLFISLHVNANDLGKVEGLETYILNFATDRSAMAVAARENATADKTISELNEILQILARNTKIVESGALAQTIHKAAVTALSKDYKVRDLGVKEAPFFVLAGTESPAMLMEIGFITNEKEAGRLKTETYLDRLADGLADGLAGYLKGFSADSK